jgi:hypothetical protein
LDGKPDSFYRKNEEIFKLKYERFTLVVELELFLVAFKRKTRKRREITKNPRTIAILQKNETTE